MHNTCVRIRTEGANDHMVAIRALMHVLRARDRETQEFHLWISGAACRVLRHVGVLGVTLKQCGYSASCSQLLYVLSPNTLVAHGNHVQIAQLYTRTFGPPFLGTPIV